jgi:ethanolaminephosphotransferase
MKFLKYKCLTPEGEENLKKYKYSGGDASLLYKYIHSPFAQWAVDNIIPEWMAPNVITLLGFTCSLIPHTLLACMFPDNFAGDVPRWLSILTGVMHLVYMHLDNMDGKQARKTGNSSPLGLLFDHGCDAMTTFITGMSLYTCCQFSNGWQSMLSYLIVFTPFFLATWEEYYLDGLYLPAFNGPNEGSMGVISLFVLGGVMGSSFWLQPVAGIPLNSFVVALFSLMSFVTACSNLYNVYKASPEKFASRAFTLISLYYIVATMGITFFLSPSNVYAQAPRLFLYFIGFSFAKLVGHIQVAHVAHMPFNQFRINLWIPFTIWNINTFLGFITKGGCLNELTLLYVLTAWAVIAYAGFTVNIINEFTTVLGIRCFKVKPKVTDTDTGDKKKN